jgi:diguanylate cyclase (GGDEF)-like protein/PAS domain S-box-containing protein
MWRKYIISRLIGGVLVIAFICFFIGALIYSFASTELIKNEEESLVNVTLQGVRTIEKDIKAHFYILEAIAGREDIKDLNYPLENKLEILRAEVEDYAFKRISIADINGYTKTSDDKEFYVGDREYFKRAVKGENVISEPITSRADGTLVIIFAVSVFYNEGLPGVLYATYDIDHLYKMTQDIKLGNRGSSFIINSVGKIIADVNRDLVYDMNTNQSEFTDNSELSQLDQLRNYVIENNIGTKQYSYGGIKKIAGFAPIPKTKWYLIVTAPKNLVFKNIRKVLSFMAAVAIIMIIIPSISHAYVSYMRYKARKQEKISKLTIEAANIIIMNFNHKWEVIHFNKYAEAKSGYKKENVIGIKTIFDIVSKDDLDKVEKFVSLVKKRQPFFNYELPLIDADGNLLFVIWNTNISRDMFGNIIGIELVGMDITDRIESERQLIRNHKELTQLYEELSVSEVKLKRQYDELLYNKEQLERRKEYIRELAYHDFLTKLPNRIYFEEKFQHNINKGNSSMSILFIDIDNFKYINDYFGHSFGDNLLVELAKRIKTVSQYKNFTARFGGDEFIVLANVSNREEAKNCAEELLEAISMSFSIRGVTFSISASIGISMYPEDGTNFDELLRNADTAMYKAKEQVEYLGIHGCDMAQGYSISKPVPEPEVLSLLGKYNNK